MESKLKMGDLSGFFAALGVSKMEALPVLNVDRSSDNGALDRLDPRVGL